MLFARLKRLITLIKRDVLTLAFACRDPQTPLWCKGLAAGLLAYGISPIDLIPDVIPVVGLVDDAVIIPAGVMLLLKMLPREVRARSVARAQQQRARGKKVLGVLGVIFLLWIALIVYLVAH
ncbi:YkvA family protein [Pantoea stewartii]|uniref:YkvA family protein n=1 Tax=Pantoea stewartii TaxID=66269 RepID=UPI003369A664